MEPRLIYGQVKKCYRRRKLVQVKHVMRLGTEDALQLALQHLGFSGRLNTAFIERVNLTVRHGIAALARRTWATVQQSPQLLAHLEWWRAYYHGCRAPIPCCEWHSCSLENEAANALRNGTGSGRRPWQRGEHTDDGQSVRCSRAPCHRSPLERLTSQMGGCIMSRGGCCMCHQQDSDGASLWEGKAYPDCPMTYTQLEAGLERLVDLSTISNRSTGGQVGLFCYSVQLSVSDFKVIGL